MICREIMFTTELFSFVSLYSMCFLNATDKNFVFGEKFAREEEDLLKPLMLILALLKNIGHRI